MTGRDLISASLRLIGALASGESLQPAEAMDGLAALNQLLDSWSTEELLIPNKVREEFTLTPNKKAYTMGTGGDFDTSRPQLIEEAGLNVGAAEIPVNVIGKEEYALINVKSTPSSIPTHLYPDNAYPLTTLTLWPVPTEAYSLVLYSWKPLANLATIDTSISLPPGYERALRYNLAVELAPEYGKAIPDVVGSVALDSKASIKRMNYRPRLLRVDESLTAGHTVWWPSIFGGNP